jgi:hypothetical protein
MTRNELLRYIANENYNTLTDLGLPVDDTPEGLFYVLNDAMAQETDELAKAEAGRLVAVLLHDRRDMLGVEQDVDASTGVSVAGLDEDFDDEDEVTNGSLI